MGDVVISDEIKHLCLINVSGIGKRMEDPVRVEREILPVPHLCSVLGFFPQGIFARARPWGEVLLFPVIEVLSQGP